MIKIIGGIFSSLYFWANQKNKNGTIGERPFANKI
jgi:hypothetical protein